MLCIGLLLTITALLKSCNTARASAADCFVSVISSSTAVRASRAARMHAVDKLV
jgi:hypothetical protein